MMDLLLQMGLSNACFALVLALVAMTVGARARRPHLAHLLWLLVFVKLVTPPLVTIPAGVFSLSPDRVSAGARASLSGEPSAVPETVREASLPANSPSLVEPELMEVVPERDIGHQVHRAQWRVEGEAEVNRGVDHVHRGVDHPHP